MGDLGQQMKEEFTSLKFWRAVGAEFVGMTLFLFMGLGATSNWSTNPNEPADFLRIAFTFGIAIATFVHCTAHISGGHLNPAVSLGFFFMHRISPLRFIMYVAAQMLGAVIGTGLIKAVTPEVRNALLGPTVLSPGVEPAMGLLMEGILTFQLVFTIFATVDGGRSDMKGSGPLAIGLAVALGHMTGINYTGASMNPARTFGSAAIGGDWSDQWVYWIGPFAGAILAAICYDWFLDPNASFSRVGKVASCDYSEDTGSADDQEMQMGSVNSPNNGTKHDRTEVEKQ